MKSKKGILLPDNIIAVKTKEKNKTNTKIFKFVFFIKLNVTIKKNKNRENLCRKPPAIASLLNIPVVL